MRKIVLIASGLGLAVALAGCSRPQEQAAQAKPAAGQTEYAAPPELTAASRGVDSGVILTGKAAPGARVRLTSPDGRAIGVTAGPEGAWSTTLAPSASPQMFAFEAEAGGRVIKAEGPVLALPAPAPAAVTPRAGFGALPVGPAGAPAIVTVDYDADGGAAVAGLAPPRSLVRLLIDGAQAGSDQTDERGRFAIIAVRPVALGEHSLEITTGAAGDRVRAAVSAPAPLSGQFYRAAREDGRWRVDWALTGGGVQTTVVFDEHAGSLP